VNTVVNLRFPEIGLHGFYLNLLNYVRFKALATASMKMTVFWDAAIALIVVTVRTPETSVNFYETVRRNIPEDSHLHKDTFRPKLLCFIYI
jgi:hypothetical protein